MHHTMWDNHNEIRYEMTSGYIPPKDELDLGEIFTALRDALTDNPRLAEMPEEGDPT